MCRKKKQFLSLPFPRQNQSYALGIIPIIFLPSTLKFPFIQINISIFHRIVEDKFVATCHRIEGMIIVNVWDLQSALVSQATSGDGEQRETAGNPMVPLFRKEVNEPDPHPLRTWSMSGDEFQIILFSEIKDASDEPSVKFIFSLKFI